MIQNRITMLTSLHPASSKWCCSGTIRNIRLAGSRNEPIWMIQVIVMITKSSAEDRQQQHGPGGQRQAGDQRRRAPSAPVSPMKIRAGEVFHHRNPTQAPAAAAGDQRDLQRVAHLVAVVAPR